MLIDTFIKEYDLHDSLLENIRIKGEKLTLDIDLCNWRQKNYSHEEDEVKIQQMIR